MSGRRETGRGLRLLLNALALLVGCWLLRPSLAWAAPELLVVGSGAEGFKFSTSDVKFSHRFRIVAKTDEVPGPVVFSLPAFQDAAGVEYATQVKWAAGSAPSAVTLTDAAELVVEAVLPGVGEYSTELALVYAKTRSALRVVVTRVQATAAPIQELQIESVGATAVQLESQPWDSELKLRVRLRELSGAPRRLPRPELSSFDLKGAGTDVFQANGRLAEIHSNGTDIAEELPLAAGALQTLDLTLVDVNQPGQYQGSLRIRPDERRKPLDIPLLVSVKRPWWLAAGWILAGVLVSTWLRWYVTKGRDLSLAERDLTELQARLTALAQAPLGDEEQRLEQHCEQQLAERRAQLGDARSVLAKPLDPGPAIALLASKVRLLETLSALYRQVATIPASARTALRTTLDTQVAALIAAQTAEAVLTVAKALGEVKVRDAQRSALSATLISTSALLEAPRPSLPAEERAALDAERVKLRAVQALLDADDLREAQLRLPPVRGTIVGILARGLGKELAGARPETTTEARWAEITQEITPQLAAIAASVTTDPEAAVNDYARLLARYASLSLAAAAEVVRDLLATVNQGDHEHKDELAQALTALLQTLVAADSATVSDVLALLRRTDQSLHDLRARLSEGAVFRKVASTNEAGEARGVWFAPEPAQAVRTTAGVDATVAPRRGTAAADWEVTAVLLLIALLSGLKALWLADAAWGGTGASLTALLWGLGLHSVGNVAFDGLVGLRDKFAKLSA